ncbi:transcription initiation factor TFIID subunit 11-like [Antedon mediterranea]|uniref:transcription initiation factor TFIID subunit 11-like n=1 Tax=Antedon mediterranea TaxID=105859 RepID=UPI003AF5889F
MEESKSEKGVKRKHDSISLLDEQKLLSGSHNSRPTLTKKGSPKTKDQALKSHEGPGVFSSSSKDLVGLGDLEEGGEDTDRSREPLAKIGRFGSVTDEEHHLQKSKEDLAQEEREKMQVLVEAFSEEQLNRYEMFRRAAFPRAAVKRIMQSITGGTVSQNVVIAMAGIAKVYVGEIVEQGLDAVGECGDVGPLQPKHIREAVRRLKAQDNFPTTKYKNSMFR